MKAKNQSVVISVIKKSKINRNTPYDLLMKAINGKEHMQLLDSQFTINNMQQ